MRKKHYYFSILLSLLLAACSSDEPGLEGNGLQEDSLSEPQRTVVKLVRDFRHTAESAPTNARTKGLPSLGDITIDGIERQHYTVNLGTQSSLYGTASIAGSERATAQPDTAQFDLYTVTFHSDTVHGFAIASPDPRLQRVYAYVESGSVTDTAFIEPMRWAIEAIPDIAREDIKIRYTEETSSLKSAIPDYTIGPIVTTKWGQEYPYNMLMPKCVCGKHKNMLAGCVTIATAQTIAKCGKFSGTFWGNKDINFNLIANHTNPYTTTEDTIVARFVHEVAVNCQTKFGCKGSSSTLKVAYHYLQDLGYHCSYSETYGFPELKAKMSFAAGCPILVAGNLGITQSGHCWIVDGIARNNGGILYSTNWGWRGQDDGWYADYRTSPTGGSYTYNNRVLFIRP